MKQRRILSVVMELLHPETDNSINFKSTDIKIWLKTVGSFSLYDMSMRQYLLSSIYNIDISRIHALNLWIKVSLGEIDYADLIWWHENELT